MTRPLDTLPEELRKRLKRCEQPYRMRPMLATLTEKRFSDDQWIFERKFDGERCIAFRKGNEVRLLSRNRKRLNETYPEIVQALAAQPGGDFILDGEVVAFDGNLTSFAKLKIRMRQDEPKENVPVFYYVFDLLHIEGYETTRLPLVCRKELLRQVIVFNDPLRYTEHRIGEGEKFYEEACNQGWEGIIAKEAQSPYIHSRSRHWLKFKCVNQQEFVIGGYTEPKGSRLGFGALLIGYYEGDTRRLVYAGMVGTGFDDETLGRLYSQMAMLKCPEPSFESENLPEHYIHWVQPKLVAEVGFTEWTSDGKLRHPRFLGLCQDKLPQMVVRQQKLVMS
jgi:bifunctional non-homologous end joining protein LigD